MKKYFFTMIEILVIIGIMAVLACILFPTFSRAIERSRSAACGNNLRQITMSFQLYKSDNKQFPFPWRWLDDFSPLEKYVQSPRIFRCPARRLPPITDMSLLCGGTDYLFYNGFDFTDEELHNNLNNGHGNNESAYGIDPSNPNFKKAAALKSKIPLVYDKSGPIHFKGINSSSLLDSRVEYRTTMRDLWFLNAQGKLDLRDREFP